MKKPTTTRTNALKSLNKEALIRSSWLASAFGFVFLYVGLVLKTVLGFGLNARVIHALCCVSLIVMYGACICFKTPSVNAQKLLRDGDFRSLLVACSFLGMRRALVPMLPFFFLSCLSISAYVVKNRKMFEKSPLFEHSLSLSSRRDEVTLLAFKIEIVSIPILFLFMLMGAADLFVVVSYISLVWFEYNTNPCMKKAVKEVVSLLDSAFESPIFSSSIRKRYHLLKEHVSVRVKKMQEPDSSKEKEKTHEKPDEKNK